MLVLGICRVCCKPEWFLFGSPAGKRILMWLVTMGSPESWRCNLHEAFRALGPEGFSGPCCFQVS